MKRFRLSRRAVLRGAGGIAIALPWLEIMSPASSYAQTLPARRFLAIYTPGGTVLERWRPSGSEADFELSPILSPLSGVKSAILVIDGLKMASAIGDQRGAGMGAWLTGTPQSRPSGYAGGPSLDQVIARVLERSVGVSSLEFAVRWGTGKTRGELSVHNAINYTAAERPIQPQLDPVAIWNELFGGGTTPDANSWDASILDAVGERYAALSRRLGAADRRRIDEHLTYVRQLEARVSAVARARCAPPALIDTSSYDPHSGRTFVSPGNVHDPETDAAIPKVGKLMMDMLVVALACDLTQVATLQWSDSQAQYSLPWLDLPEVHYYYQNDGGFRAAECEKIATWYSEQHAYLLQKMAAVDMGGHSLLDESVVFFGSEVQHPGTHSIVDMPFLLAGRGGGLRPGRWLDCGGKSHNDLLVALLNRFGDPAQTFGDPMFCSGPLTGLT